MKKIINYSGIAGLVLISSLFLLTFSCNKDTVQDNPNSDISSQLIKVSGEDANAATKTTLSGLVTSWIATTDKVGIYSSTARTQTGGGGDPVVNAEFTAAGSGVSSNFNGTMYWGAASTSHTFYAYYPWVSGTAASTVVPVSLPSAQTQSEAGNSAHIGALDFLVATPVTVTSPNNTNSVANEVNLKYNHLFTVLEFQIKGTGQLKAVKLAANTTLAFSGGTINVTQATPATDVAYTFASQTGTSGEVTTTLTSSATLTATNADTKVYMVINPGTPTGNCLIGLSVDGTNWNYINKAAPVGGFKRGIKYVVTVDADNIDFSTVVSSGMVWMDRNLGASQIATSSTDALAYGDLYQWGRGSDGHQIRTSGTTSTLSSTDVPGHANFILATDDWRSPQNTNLWQGVNGVNNPCPSGFRLPTKTEWSNERETWATDDAAGAFASPLKLTVAGYRDRDGTLDIVDGGGFYWSSTVDFSNSNFLVILSSSAFINIDYRVYGISVRCIKDY